jgi:hypothetical protein
VFEAEPGRQGGKLWAAIESAILTNRDLVGLPVLRSAPFGRLAQLVRAHA